MSNSAEVAAPPPTRGKDRFSSGLPRWQAAVLLLADCLALRFDSRPPFPAVDPRSELLPRDLRPPVCFVCSLAGPEETASDFVVPILDWSPAGCAEPASAGSGSLGRGDFLGANVSADPSGGGDHFVSGVEVFSRHPLPLGVSDSDDPAPDPDPAAGHLSASVAGLKARHRAAATGRSSGAAAREP